MGQQLETKLVFFGIAQRNDCSDLETDESVVGKIPLFYIQEEGQALVRNVCTDDCSALHPYFQIQEQRETEEYPLEETTNPSDTIDEDEADLVSLADRDVDFDECCLLEEQFDLQSLAMPDGFIIVCLPGSVFSLAPWDALGENEEEMLRGFDLQAPDIPRVPMLCEYSRLS